MDVITKFNRRFVRKVESLIKTWERAVRKLEEVESEVVKVAQVNGISLLYTCDTFTPIWWAENEELLRYDGVRNASGEREHGYLVLMQDGSLVWKPRARKG